MDQPDIRDRLLAHFSVPADDFNSRWSSLWDTGDFLPWDQGAPSPALTDILQGRKDLIGDSVFVDGRRKRALVAGCGRGYDVLLLASFGYDAYGLDISEAAVKECDGFASEHAAEYPAKDAGVGAGNVRFISGDFFTVDWEGKVDGGATFELIYDYTFLSALDPSMRPNWALRYTQLLSSATPSRLVCLEYPTHKNPAERGPPFALPPKIYFNHLTHPSCELPYDDDLNLLEDQVSPEKSKGALERIAHWQPEKTHPIGMGTDWVSVWKRAE